MSVKYIFAIAEIRRLASDSRLVLYTGKNLEPSTIIECARWGVTEYLVKGSLGGDLLAKKLSLLALNPDNTLAKLGAPSGAVQQLIQEAEKAVKELETERAGRRRVEEENTSLKSAERREIILQVSRFVFATLYLIMAGVLVWFGQSLGGGVWTAIFCCLVAFGGLFLFDRSVSQFVVRVGKSQLGITRRGGR